MAIPKYSLVSFSSPLAGGPRLPISKSSDLNPMALKAIFASGVPPALRRVAAASPSLAVSLSTALTSPNSAPPEFIVIGHRGHGMNSVSSPDQRFRAIKENSILSFNRAAKLPITLVEFDVQVTRDGHPIIFHDTHIVSRKNSGEVYERRVADLSLQELLSYGPQTDPTNPGKPLLRKASGGGEVFPWEVDADDSLCTLREAFEKVDNHIGFNIELKFNDDLDYTEEELALILRPISEVVSDCAKERPVVFSSFHPDAALLMRTIQGDHPVFFLTDGGWAAYKDARMNSMEAAIKLCSDGGLQGIVSEVRGVFANPAAAVEIKRCDLGLLTYGELNNVPEAVYLQHLMGVDGVIVDLVPEITEAVSGFVLPAMRGGAAEGTMPEFSRRELSFLLKLIPELLRR